VWDVIEKLKQGRPGIFTADYLTQLYYPDSIVVDPTTLADGEEEIVGQRILEILGKG